MKKKQRTQKTAAHPALDAGATHADYINGKQRGIAWWNVVDADGNAFTDAEGWPVHLPRKTDSLRSHAVEVVHDGEGAESTPIVGVDVTGPSALRPIRRAQESHDLTEMEFRRQLGEREIVLELRRLKLWRDEPDAKGRGITAGDLWQFYLKHGSSVYDKHARELHHKTQSLNRAAKVLKQAATEIRWSLTLGDVVPWLPYGEATVLRQAADILDVSLRQSLDLEASGKPPDRIGGYADRLRAVATALRRKEPGRPRDRAKRHFREQWESFARSRTAGRNSLDSVGEALVAICFDVAQIQPGSRAKQKQRARHETTKPPNKI